ncbi:hypothetical protein EV183_003961 [Coemansia sp. RSA 2336]|nr:hypothetical protein EV183_003961 [Coemansia sp. RSA 2336]
MNHQYSAAEACSFGPDGQAPSARPEPPMKHHQHAASGSSEVGDWPPNRRPRQRNRSKQNHSGSDKQQENEQLQPQQAQSPAGAGDIKSQQQQPNSRKPPAIAKQRRQSSAANDAEVKAPVQAAFHAGKAPGAAPREFVEHYTPKAVKEMLRRGTLVRGVLRVNAKNSNDAYVTLDATPSACAQKNIPELCGYSVGSSNDIYICGSASRNRAISGDVVAVKILSRNDSKRLYKRYRRSEDQRKDRMFDRQRARLQSMADGVREATGDSAPEGNGDEDPSDSQESARSGPHIPELFGEVVAIITPNHDRTFVGTITDRGPFKAKKRDAPPGTLWFLPLDPALPRMAVSNKNCVPSSMDRDTICAARMGGWPATSRHPQATFLKCVGRRGAIEIETELILEENCVKSGEFSDDVLGCLPKTPWQIPQAVLKSRTDLRSSCIFTIDPPTARDLDDAVSCQQLPNGNLLVGVHIADVSFFVRPRTALDKEAQLRATTTYMVQRAYPMLPSVLCEDLCSLNPGVDRLAFSVMWEMKPQSAEVVSTWFGRTVINSACKLSYDDAQNVIDGGHLPEPLACYEHARKQTAPASLTRRAEIEASIRCFYKLSLMMRQRRFDEGALSLNRVRLSFDLDESGAPCDCRSYPIRDSNRLIEEFMLLANMSVAARIEACFPNCALLRRHPPPLQRRLEELCRQLRLSGIDIDTRSAGSIARSIRSIDDANVRYTVEEMMTAPMQRATYFATHAVDNREEYRHYALNAPLYTHFTSPIRRYADVIVHRTLEASLAAYGNHVASEHPLLPAYYSPYFPKTLAKGSLTTKRGNALVTLVPPPELLASIAHQCNLRKDAAKKAQEASSKLFLVSYLSTIAQSSDVPGAITHAVVTKIRESSFSILCPAFGVEALIYMDRMADRKNQVVFTDGRNWKLHLWSVERASIKLVWKVSSPSTKAPEDQIAESLSALVIDDSQHSAVNLNCSRSSDETVTQTIRIFSKLSVCITPVTSPPDLSVKLAMPCINA